MPHFIIECNQQVAESIDQKKLVKTVFQTATDTGLFAVSNIKSRLQVYNASLVAGEDRDFIHVWGYIRKGRTSDQKRLLSEQIVNRIRTLGDFFVISCNIGELDEDSYVKIQANLK